MGRLDAYMYHFYRMKEDHRILLSTDGPYENIIKFKPPMCFTKQDVDNCMEKIEHILKDLPKQEFKPSHRWTVVDPSSKGGYEYGSKGFQLKSSL